MVKKFVKNTEEYLCFELEAKSIKPKAKDYLKYSKTILSTSLLKSAALVWAVFPNRAP